MAARLFGSLVFLALIGFVVASPVLFGQDTDLPPVPGSSEQASPSPHPTERDDSARRETTQRLAARYPSACLRPVASAGPEGLVAAYSKGAVRIANVDGDVRATIRAPGGIVRPPIAWSPSGRILAVGPQGLFWRPNGTLVSIGDVQHGLVEGRRGTWGWSPLADCGVQVSESGALHAVAANPFVAGVGTVLIEDGVESFSFAPDGQKLGLVLKDGNDRSIWIADLVRNRMHQARDFPRHTCCISLGGWTPSGDELLFWAGSGASVMADGWLLESVGGGGEGHEWGTTIPSASLAECDKRLLGVVGGDRHGRGGRLAVLRSNQSERFLTDKRDRVSAFSCSPDDRYFVAQSDARLALLDSTGTRVRYLTDIDTPNGQFSEFAPEWGPPRTGILFVRGLHLVSQLWFIPEGAATERPVVDLELSGRWNAHSLFDWSVTPPSGLPAG